VIRMRSQVSFPRIELMAFGFLLGLALSNSVFVAGVISILLSFLYRSLVGVSDAIFVGTSALSGLVLIVRILETVQIQLTQWHLFVILAVLSTILARVIRVSRFERSETQEPLCGDFALLGVMFLLVVWVVAFRQSGNDGTASLFTLVEGEDNGTWLQWASETLASNQFPKYVTSLGFADTASKSSGVFLAATKLLSPTLSGPLSSAVLLDRTYGYLVILLTVGAATTVRELLRSHIKTYSGAVLLSALAVFELSRRLVSVGHLTALIALVGLLAIVKLAVVSERRQLQPRIQVALVILLAVLIFDAWGPLSGLSILIVVSVLARNVLIRRRVIPHPSLPARESTLVVTVVAGAILLAVMLKGQLPSFDELVTVLELRGEVAPLTSTWSLLVLVGSVFAVNNSRFKSHSRGLDLRIAVNCLIVYVVAVRVGSLFLVGFESYAAAKLSGLATVALLPIAIAGVFRETSHSKTLSFAAGALSTCWLIANFVTVDNRDLWISAGVCVALVSRNVALFIRHRDSSDANFVALGLLALTLGLSNPGLSREPIPSSSRTSPPALYRGLATAMVQSPARNWMCHNSDESSGEWSYETYRCSRLAAGLQGLNNEFGGAYLSFSAAQLCAVSVNNFEQVNTGAFKNLGIVINDSTALTTTQYCQSFGWVDNPLPKDPQYPLGWASLIDWRTAEVRDVQGRVVNKSFDYLRGRSGYEDSTVVNLLNDGLLENPPTAQALLCGDGQSVFACRARFSNGQIRPVQPKRNFGTSSRPIDRVTHQDDAKNDYCVTLYANQAVGFVAGKCE